MNQPCRRGGRGPRTPSARLQLGRTRRGILVSVGVAALVVVGVAFGFAPATRTLVASQTVCFGCHDATEYDYARPGSPSKRHPEDAERGEAARCADCHVTPGLAGAVHVYGHVLAGTDLFGEFIDRRAGRTGDAVTPVTWRAYAVDDQMLAHDSAPCRSCHIESEIKPKRKRGQNAHERARERGETCIECHYNFAHREVPERE